jgi:hypothetical protein
VVVSETSDANSSLKALRITAAGRFDSALNVLDASPIRLGRDDEAIRSTCTWTSACEGARLAPEILSDGILTKLHLHTPDCTLICT